MIQFDQHLDTSGLLCPLPILKARKQLSLMRAGEILSVISTDENSVLDFKAFVQSTGHELLEVTQENGQYRFLIKKVVT